MSEIQKFDSAGLPVAAAAYKGATATTGNGIAAAIASAVATPGKPVAATTAATTPVAPPIVPQPVVESAKRGRPLGSKNAPKDGSNGNDGSAAKHGQGAAIAELRESQKRTDNILGDLQESLKMIAGKLLGKAAPPVVQAVQTAAVNPIVAYPPAGPSMGAPGVYNPLAATSVADQHEAAAVASLVKSLQPGQVPVRDCNVYPVQVVERDKNGNPVLDAAGAPVMKTVKAKTHPVRRRYIEATLATIGRVELAIMVNGVPTGATMPMRFNTSKSSGNPQFYCSDPSFSIVNADGNVMEFKGGGMMGLYFSLMGYTGAPLIEAAESIRYEA